MRGGRESSVRHEIFPGTDFIDAALDALRVKDAMSRQATIAYLQRAGMAGILIGVFYGAYFASVATFGAIPAGATTLAGVGRVLGAFIFGWALVMIYYTKSELLTSTMMLTSIGVYHRRISARRALGIMALCLLGNGLGGLLVGVLGRYSTIMRGAVLEQMLHAVDVKLGYVSAGSAGLGDLFIRAILCNFMINVAMLLVYNGFVHEDIAKMVAMNVAVFIFAYLGLEHSVANTVLFTIVGLSHGIDVGLALANVGVALLGNFVGGGVLIGLYYAYVNDPRRHGVERAIGA